MRNIENRLRKLEAKLNAPEKRRVVGLATVAHAAPWKRKQNLLPGERVVIDWYDNRGGTVWGRERITTDPTDHGSPLHAGWLST